MDKIRYYFIKISSELTWKKMANGLCDGNNSDIYVISELFWGVCLSLSFWNYRMDAL